MQQLDRVLAPVVRVRILPQPIDGREIKLAVHKLQQVAPETDLEINDLDGSTVLLRSPSDAALEQAWGRLTAIVAELADERARTPQRATFHRDVTSDPDRSYHRPSELSAGGEMGRFPEGRGYFTGAAAALLYAVDRLFLDLARREAAVPFYSEPVWERADLPRFGYADGASALCRIGHIDPAVEQYWQNATCDNVWKSLASARIDGFRCYTAVSTCCRSEVSQYFFLERMKTFRMREVVAVGRPEEILAFRERAIEFIAGLTGSLGLNGLFEDSNDPFFLSGENETAEAPVGVALPEIVKIELRLRLYDEKTLACASMNVHGDFFARNFGYVSADGGPLWTSCIAFGLERWVWAILVQFGPEPQGWPAAIRALVEGAGAYG
jgi:seryl-tRNA synthetase